MPETTLTGLACTDRCHYGIREHRSRIGQPRRLYSIVMISFKNLVCAFMLLALLAESNSLFAQTPPNNQCRRAWEVNTVQEMNFGGFVAEGGNATVTMNSTGGLTTSGPVSLSTSIPATTLTINVNNTLNPACATYGFTVELTRTPPRPLTGPGTPIGLDNVLLSIPVYNINNVNLPHVVDPGAGNTAPFTIKIHGRISVNDTNTDGEYSRGLNVRVILNGLRNRQATTVTATSIVPLSIAENVPMNFGTVAGGSLPGTVILSTGNGRITTGDAETLAAGPGNAATFEVAGEPNNSFSLSFSDGVLANASGQQMNVTSFTHNSAGTIPGLGPESFQVGATLNVGASQQSGTYSTSNAGGNPYSVIVNYN